MRALLHEYDPDPYNRDQKPGLRGRGDDIGHVPEISRFFGIVVQMYYNDHEPPHFHVRYTGQKALIAIDP